MPENLSPDVVVQEDDVARRIIEPDRFVPDAAAFIDVRIPGSEGKASYSFIGPGVSQNSGQTINLSEPHGFNIGAATLPHGVVNNPHLHYTAEVFICTRGRFEMQIGQHGEQTVEIGAGTVFSVPTWVFRGFTNIGDDDGWLFTVLGDDDTGGILWAPQILEAAAETGLHLSPSYEVIDAADGPVPKETVTPLDQERLKELDSYTDDELLERIVTRDQLSWSEFSLLSTAVPGHDVAIAPVIGFGLTEDRRHRSPIASYHGFSLEWLRITPGSSLGQHRLDQNQVMLLDEGQWEIVYNRGSDQVRSEPASGSIVSIPAGCWRDAFNVGNTDALALVICDGDSPARVRWDEALASEALQAGWVRDASGYVAPVDLAGRLHT